MKVLYSEIFACFPKGMHLSWLGMQREFFMEIQVCVDSKGDLYHVTYQDIDLREKMTCGDFLYYGHEDYFCPGAPNYKTWQDKKKRRILCRHSEKISKKKRSPKRSGE